MNSEHIRLRDIEKQYARVPTAEEAAVVMEDIKRDANIEDGLPVIPNGDSSDFERVPITVFQSDDDLRNQVQAIFGQGVESMYVLSEEESIGSRGLTKFRFQDLQDRVLPYLREWGQLTNYWLTDGTSRTVTFHKEGIVYWRKQPVASDLKVRPH